VSELSEPRSVTYAARLRLHVLALATVGDGRRRELASWLAAPAARWAADRTTVKNHFCDRSRAAGHSQQFFDQKHGQQTRFAIWDELACCTA
jgi:hypothetical protein